MTNVVRLAFVDPAEATRSSLKSLLLGLDSVWLEAECSRYEFFADVIDQSQPDVALISLDADPEKALNLVQQVHTSHPTCNLFVASASQEGSLILRAMRAGSTEFLNHPVEIDDMLAALERVGAGGGGDGAGASSSRIISVAGVSGGIGSTSLAINLACSLAKDAPGSVNIIDLDFALGDADVWLDIIPDYTIQDVAENISRLDYSLLKRSLSKHECGAFLLPRPVHMDDRLPVSAEELRRIAALLKATFPYMVFDLSKSFNSLDMAAMELSDDILVVTQLDLPSLRNVVRLTQFLDERDDLRSKVRVIVNRLGLGDKQISLSKALETIGRETFWQVPNDYAVMVESRNNGVPLVMQAPKAKVTRSIIDLANALAFEGGAQEIEAEEDEKKAKGLFSFLAAAGKS